MKIVRNIAMLLVVSSCGFNLWAAAAPAAPMWAYADTGRVYGALAIYDTCRSGSYNRIYPTDTGAAYNGTEYINFNYQFSTDPMFVLDPYADPANPQPSDTIYKDLRPGYAGYKIDWDGGVTGFAVAKYNAVIVAHKGPLPTHQVTLRWGYNTVCGSPTVFQVLGSFHASSNWELDTVRIPDFVTNIPKDSANNRNYYELEILVTNVDPNGPGTSAPGNLKIDNIRLINLAPAAEESKKCGCGSGTGLAFIPPILFKVMASRKRKKKVSKV